MPPPPESTAPTRVAPQARPEGTPDDDSDGGGDRDCGRGANDNPTGLPRGLREMYEFFSSWRFPVLTMAVMFSFEAFQLTMLVLPAADTGLGAFAEEFRVWCYGLDEETGKLELGYVGMFLGQPAAMALVLGVIWKHQILDVFRKTPAKTLPYLVLAAAMVTSAMISLVGLGSASEAKAAFPAAALRMAKNPHPIALVNQEGEAVALKALRGKVVVVTGVYATCAHTCPLIMAQIRGAVSKLTPEAREQVRVLAITLNPDHDKTPVLKQASERYQARAPTYHFLGGESAKVNKILDAYEIARRMNHDTKQIDHANLFIVVDKRGKLAYRLTLGSQQEQWLTDALRLLAKET